MTFFCSGKSRKSLLCNVICWQTSSVDDVLKLLMLKTEERFLFDFIPYEKKNKLKLNLRMGINAFLNFFFFLISRHSALLNLKKIVSLIF